MSIAVGGSIALPTFGAAEFETFDGLKSWVLQILDRNDLSGVINKMVRMAENHLRRKILAVNRESVALLNATGETVNLPADFKQARNVRLLTNPPVTLSQLGISTLQERYGYSGQPMAYAVGNGQLILGPIPDGPYNLSLRYLQTIPYLSDTNPTNWLLSNHADVYVYATLVQAEAFIKEDLDSLAKWKAALEEAIRNINSEGVRYRHSGTPARISSPVVV